MNAEQDAIFEMADLDAMAIEAAPDDISDTIRVTDADYEDLGEIEAAPKKPKRKATPPAKNPLKVVKGKVVGAKEAKAPKAPKEPKEVKVKAAKEPKAPKEPKEPKAPKIARPDREAARGILGTETFDMIATAALPRKVGEKAQNLLDAVAGRGRLSVYTAYTLEALHKDGAITSTDLVKLLEERGYTGGTSRSQAQQMMTLLPAIGLATKEKNVITLDRTSPVFTALQQKAA